MQFSAAPAVWLLSSPPRRYRGGIQGGVFERSENEVVKSFHPPVRTTRKPPPSKGGSGPLGNAGLCVCGLELLQAL